ncbi:hypothetical protein V5O48_018842, partial [Marasmius crinis-equi]
MSSPIWEKPSSIPNLRKMDDFLSMVHSRISQASLASLGPSAWQQVFAGIHEPLTRLHLIHDRFKKDESFPSIVEEVLFAASLLAYKHGFSGITPWQRSQEDAEEAALFSPFDFSQPPLRSYLNHFLPPTHQLSWRSDLPSAPASPQQSLVPLPVPPSSSPTVSKKPPSSRPKSPVAAPRQSSPVAARPSKVKTKPKAPQAPKPVASSSKTAPSAKLPSASERSPSPVPEDVPAQVRQRVLDNIGAKRTASPVVEKSSQPHRSGDRKPKPPKGPTPLPAHGTRRRRPESPDPRPQTPVVADSDSDYVDEGSDQEASRPRKRKRRHSPSRAEKLMFTDDEECGPPDIRRNKKEKNEVIEPIAEAAGLAIRGPGAAQCSLERLAGSFRNQEIVVPHVRCVHCILNRNPRCNPRPATRSAWVGTRKEESRTFWECESCQKAKVVCSISADLQAFQPWRTLLTSSAIRHPDLLRRILTSIFDLTDAHQRLREALSHQVEGLTLLETQIQEQYDFLKLVGQDPRMVLSVIAQDTPRKLTDDDHRILASIFGWATIPDLSGTHLEEPSPGNFVLYDELHQVLARLGPGTQASTSSTIVETPFDDDVPADNAQLSEQDVGATLFPPGEEDQSKPLADDLPAEMEVDAPSPKAPVARTGFSFFPALFSREKPPTESAVVEHPVV